jgi:ParB-like chromosome segregation protein Spo0J
METTAITGKVKTLAEGTVAYVPLDRLKDHPEIQPLRPLNKDFVANLTTDIRSNGLISPLLVWNGGTEEGATTKAGEKTIAASFLIAGFHRRAALRRFHKDDADGFESRFPNGVPVFVVSGDEADVLAAQLRENINRKDMPASEVLPVVLRLKKEFKLKNKAIAQKLGKSEAWVSEILDIETQLGEEGAAAVADVEEEVKKAKGKRATLKSKGKSKAEKRTSARVVYARFQGLPNMKMGMKLDLAVKALAYLAGDSEQTELPEELAQDAEPSEDAAAE